MIYFISDTHFDHEKIIQYCNRPFKNVKEMNKTIIKNWNSVVKKNDTVIHVGDFAWKRKNIFGKVNIDSFMKKLNGKIIVLYGNHDKGNGQARIEHMIIKQNGMRIKITHNPQHASKKYDMNICGHVHGLYKFKKMENSEIWIANVGVECWNYFPVSLDEILSELKNFKKGVLNVTCK